MARSAQGRRRHPRENNARDTSIAGTAPPVVAVVYPGQSELDIGEGLPGASGHKGADFIQSSGRVPVHRVRTVPHEARPVLVVRDQMSKLYMTEVALPLEFFTQSRQMPGEPAAADRALPRRWRKKGLNHPDLQRWTGRSAG